VTPYYDDDGITIYHGDSREIVPTLDPVDLLLTDPPYGIGADRNLRAGKRHGRAVAASRDYGAGDWDSSPPPAWMIHQLLDMSTWSIIWGGNHLAIPRPATCWLVWDKMNGDNGYADCELAWSNLPHAVRMIRHRWMGMLQEPGQREVRVHPTQKPLRLMRWALSLAPLSATVLDPYMGSGTTLRAAADEGKSAIGIETEERYCEIAATRLAQRSLFGEPA
jgi:DNA modification methylase